MTSFLLIPPLFGQGRRAVRGRGRERAPRLAAGFSDLRLSIVRGVLAEFLVAKAVGATQTLKHEWTNFDVETEAGIRVDVKASAYWQSRR